MMGVASAGSASPDHSLAAQRAISAVVVTYHPDERVASRIAALQRQVANVLIVDNGSPDERFLPMQAALAGAQIMRNSRNLGIAAALNQGLAWARELGSQWLLTLDQDSDIAEDLIRQQLRAVDEHPQRDRLIQVAAHPVDDELGIEARFLRRRGLLGFERARCAADRLDGALIAIGSGSLYRVDLVAGLGGFRGDFFIDYVDTELCLRAAAHGYLLAVACGAKIRHKLGDRRYAALGPIRAYPTFHSPVRWFYIARNRIPMIRAFGWRFPSWLLYELAASAYGILRMLIFEDQRRKKLLAILIGTLQGLLGRMGTIPTNIREKLIMPA